VRTAFAVFAISPSSPSARPLSHSVSDHDRPFCHHCLMTLGCVTPMHHAMNMVSSAAPARRGRPTRRSPRPEARVMTWSTSAATRPRQGDGPAFVSKAAEAHGVAWPLTGRPRRRSRLGRARDERWRESGCAPRLSRAAPVPRSRRGSDAPGAAVSEPHARCARP